MHTRLLEDVGAEPSYSLSLSHVLVCSQIIAPVADWKCVPTLHSAHALAPADAANCPTAHGTHVPSPLLENLPAGHASQRPPSVPPQEVWKCPAEHFTLHVLHAVAPGESAKLPSPHSMQREPSTDACCPAWHTEQLPTPAESLA